MTWKRIKWWIRLPFRVLILGVVLTVTTAFWPVYEFITLVVDRDDWRPIEDITALWSDIVGDLWVKP